MDHPSFVRAIESVGRRARSAGLSFSVIAPCLGPTFQKWLRFHADLEQALTAASCVGLDRVQLEEWAKSCAKPIECVWGEYRSFLETGESRFLGSGEMTTLRQ